MINSELKRRPYISFPDHLMEEEQRSDTGCDVMLLQPSHLCFPINLAALTEHLGGETKTDREKQEKRERERQMYRQKEARGEREREKRKREI